MKPQPSTSQPKPREGWPNPQRVLVLMRHAKTESPYSLKRDFDRKLTAQGEQDAQRMGAWLKSEGFSIDQFLSSPAKRTQQTTELVIEHLGLNSSIIEYRDELYHAIPEVFFKTICAVPNEINTMLIVSHNDGITQFANQLTDARIDYMQPGSVFIVKCHLDNWSEFETAAREFVGYRQPGGG